MPGQNDPSFLRDERHARAKAAAAAMTPEQLQELRVQYGGATTPPKNRTSRTALPATGADALPVLVGDFDLVYPTHSVEDHVNGPGASWLFLTVFPHGLRSHGWVYLKVNGQLAARARVLGVGYREGVHNHTPDASGTHHLVASTPTLEVDPTTWERGDAPAAETHQQGLRYASTDDERGTITHLVGGAPLATHEWPRPGPRY